MDILIPAWEKEKRVSRTSPGCMRRVGNHVEANDGWCPRGCVLPRRVAPYHRSVYARHTVAINACQRRGITVPPFNEDRRQSIAAPAFW